MVEQASTQVRLTSPFLLRLTAVFLLADGVFKLASIFSGLMPGPEIFGSHDSTYYYLLVAVVDFSLAVQIIVRAHYAWVWGVAFFALRALVLLTNFTFSRPLSWLVPGTLGRVQLVITIAVYLLLARYMAGSAVRKILSPQSTKPE